MSGLDEKIKPDELATLFPDGVPMVAMKIIFPESSHPLTIAEVRCVLSALAASATSADVGEEPVADLIGLLQKLAHHRWAEYSDEMLIGMLVGAARRAATALEQVSRERDEARATLDEVCLSSRQEWQRATSAEAKLAEARKVIEWIRSEASSWAASYSFARRIADAARRWLEETK